VLNPTDIQSLVPPWSESLVANITRPMRLVSPKGEYLFLASPKTVNRKTALRAFYVSTRTESVGLRHVSTRTGSVGLRYVSTQRVWVYVT
jgi:hypothetical protein